MKTGQSLKSQEVIFSTSVIKKDNITKEEEILKQEEERQDKKFNDEALANVSVKAGATIALPNYSNGRIDVMLSMPCETDKINETYDKVKEFVDGKVSQEVQSLREVAEK